MTGFGWHEKSLFVMWAKTYVDEDFDEDVDGPPRIFLARRLWEKNRDTAVGCLLNLEDRALAPEAYDAATAWMEQNAGRSPMDFEESAKKFLRKLGADSNRRHDGIDGLGQRDAGDAGGEARDGGRDEVPSARGGAPRS